jgi:hypothetical protein
MVFVNVSKGVGNWDVFATKKCLKFAIDKQTKNGTIIEVKFWRTRKRKNLVQIFVAIYNAPQSHTHTHLHSHYTHTHLHIHTHTLTLSLHTCTHTLTHTHTYTYRKTLHSHIDIQKRVQSNKTMIYSFTLDLRLWFLVSFILKLFKKKIFNH